MKEQLHACVWALYVCVHCEAAVDIPDRQVIQQVRFLHRLSFIKLFSQLYDLAGISAQKNKQSK